MTPQVLPLLSKWPEIRNFIISSQSQPIKIAKALPPSERRKPEPSASPPSCQTVHDSKGLEPCLQSMLLQPPTTFLPLSPSWDEKLFVLANGWQSQLYQQLFHRGNHLDQTPQPLSSTSWSPPALPLKSSSSVTSEPPSHSPLAPKQ